jgi:hypothetical protein
MVLKVADDEAATLTKMEEATEAVLTFADTVEQVTNKQSMLDSVIADMATAQQVIDANESTISTGEMLVEAASITIEMLNEWKETFTSLIDAIPVAGGILSSIIDGCVAASADAFRLAAGAEMLLSGVREVISTMENTVSSLGKFVEQMRSVANVVQSLTETEVTELLTAGNASALVSSALGTLMSAIGEQTQTMDADARHREPVAFMYSRPLIAGLQPASYLPEVVTDQLSRMSRLPAHVYVVLWYPNDTAETQVIAMSIGDNFEVGASSILRELLSGDGLRPADLKRMCVNKSMFYAEWGTATWNGGSSKWDFGTWSTSKGETGRVRSRIAKEGTPISRFMPKVTYTDALSTVLAMGRVADESVSQHGVNSPFKYCLFSKEGLGMNCQAWSNAFRDYLESGKTPPWVRTVVTPDGGAMSVNMLGKRGRVELALCRASVVASELRKHSGVRSGYGGGHVFRSNGASWAPGITASRTYNQVRDAIVASASALDEQGFRGTAVMRGNHECEVRIRSNSPMIASMLENLPHTVVDVGTHVY